MSDGEQLFDDVAQPEGSVHKAARDFATWLKREANADVAAAPVLARPGTGWGEEGAPRRRSRKH